MKKDNGNLYYEKCTQTSNMLKINLCLVCIYTQTSVQIYVHVCKEIHETIFCVEIHIFYVKLKSIAQPRKDILTCISYTVNGDKSARRKDPGSFIPVLYCLLFT